MSLHPRLFALLAAIALPAFAAPETYVLDPDHTFPSLEMPHLGISVWRGKFNRSSGRVTLDVAARRGTVDVEVDAGSIDFGHDAMNTHALTADWLNVEKYPKARYRGEFVFAGDKPTSVEGELTLRGVTKPLTLELTSFNCIEHPYYKKPVCGADAQARFDRADYGMTQYADNGMGKLLLRIQVEAFKDALPTPPKS